MLLLLAAVVAAWKADVVSSLVTAVELAVCTVPVGWIVRQLVAELALRRLYDRPSWRARTARKAIEHRVQPALMPVPPLAAGRFVVDAEVTG